MRSRFSRPSPALVISLIALFVALGGTGYAALKVSGKNVKNRSLTGKDIKRNSLGRNEVKESSLGKVGSAGRADSAGSAGSAGSAANSSALGGRAPSAYLPGPLVKATLKNGWQSSSVNAPAAGYWVGPGPVVHVQGSITGGTDDTVAFTLPPGARPAKATGGVIDCGSDLPARVVIRPSGDVEIQGPTLNPDCTGFADLGTIAFRIDN